MSGIKLTQVDEATIPTPETGKDTIFIDLATGEPSYKDDTGAVTSLQGPAGPGVPIGGTAGQVLEKIDGTDYNTQWAAPSAGTPAGSNTQIQYNNSGSFGAEAAFTYDASTNTLAADNVTVGVLALTAASSTSSAGLRLPHGVAPTSPVNGDAWTTPAGIYVFINGVTVGPLSAANYRSTVSALSTSGSVAIDYALGDYFTLALAGNVSGLTFSNLPGSGNGASLMIQITQDSTPRTLAWPASFKWAGGTVPSISTGSGAIDVLAITTFDNGSTWKATLAKDWV